MASFRSATSSEAGRARPTSGAALGSSMVNARVSIAVSLAFVASLLCAARVAAGGPHGRHQRRTPEEERAQEVADRWREPGLAAAPEMLEALCRKDPALEGPARDGLISLRQEALPLLVRAAADPRCEVAGAIATIICETGLGGPE